MADCCEACGKVGALENDGIGGRVCTSCGHTVDDAECLTTIVSAETGMRVSESGEYFSLDPHNNVGNIRCRSKTIPPRHTCTHAPMHANNYTIAISSHCFALKTTKTASLSLFPSSFSSSFQLPCRGTNSFDSLQGETALRLQRDVQEGRHAARRG
jgi:hypothetical protein